jgi:hypothetical protein
MDARQDRVNKLFEQLIEACKEHGFSAEQISVGMQYMGAQSRKHRFRDGNTHAAILLSVNPLKATLVNELDSEGRPYWDDAVLAEYRLTDDEVKARLDEIFRREKFSRTSQIWLKNRDLLVGSFNQKFGSGGKTPNDTAAELLDKLAAQQAPEYLEFVQGIGSSDVKTLKDFLLRPYFGEREDAFWAAVLEHPSYPELVKLSDEGHAVSEKDPKSPVLKGIGNDLEVLLSKIYEGLDRELSKACSRRAFSYAPFFDQAFRTKLEEKKQRAAALKP